MFVPLLRINQLSENAQDFGVKTAQQTKQQQHVTSTSSETLHCKKLKSKHEFMSYFQ